MPDWNDDPNQAGIEVTADHWAVDPHVEVFHWVADAAAVCGHEVASDEPTTEPGERCAPCEEWLLQRYPCPTCDTSGRVRAYRQRDGVGPIRRVRETCKTCGGHGYGGHRYALGRRG